MTDLSESHWSETTGPLINGWNFGSVTPRSRSVPTQSEVSPPVDLSFRLAEPAAAPFADRSVEMTRTHGAAKSAPKDQVVFPGRGQTLGGFRIVSELGRGAFARVYLAEQLDLAGRLVALKVAEALGDEPQSLAKLQHTHIVPIYSVHDDPKTGLRLLCMPYFGGANLAQILERSGARLPSQASGRSLVKALDDLGGRPPTRVVPSQIGGMSARFGTMHGAMTGGVGSPTAVRSILGRYLALLPWSRALDDEGDDEGDFGGDDRDQPARRYLRSHSYVEAAVWIGARLAEGLEHAHARGLLHRDIKPSNILIAADGTPMLLDFNLAAAVDGGSLSEAGARAMLGGTLPYMAPEHLDAFNPMGTTAASAVDERSDVYSLGLILFEMVTGHHPFDDPPSGMRLIDVVTRMTTDRRRGAPSARSINPTVPPSLDAILAKCLDPEPARRYARAADLAEDLQRFLDDRPNAHAPEPSVRERAAKWWRRHPEVRGAGPVAATAGAILLAVGLAAWSISDYAQTARAKLRRNAFRDDFAQCQLLLNTSSGPAAHRSEGIAKAQAMLKSYAVESPGDWTAGSLVKRLPPADRRAMREEMSELMLLLARARVADVARGKTEAARRAAIEGAVALLNRAEAIDPRPSAALFQTRARLLKALGESGRAADDLHRARKAPPETARDYYLRGTARAAEGDYDGAESDLGRAVALDPKRFWAWFVQGLCHHDRGRYEEAVGDFNACTLLAPDFAWPYLNRGLSLARIGRQEEAVASYTHALVLSPDFTEALVNRSLAYLELNQPERAERDLARAMALGRREAEILAARAEALSRLGQRARAEAEFAEALRIRPDDPGVRVARGVSRIASDPAGARADFDRVLARDPRNARAHYGLALLLRRDDLPGAIEHIRRSLDADPSAMDALRLRAVLLGRIGDAAAVSDVDRLAQTPSAQNLYNAACALSLLDKANRSTSHRGRVDSLLKRAFEMGFPREHAAKDPDLSR